MKIFTLADRSSNLTELPPESTTTPSCSCTSIIEVFWHAMAKMPCELRYVTENTSPILLGVSSTDRHLKSSVLHIFRTRRKKMITSSCSMQHATWHWQPLRKRVLTRTVPSFDDENKNRWSALRHILEMLLECPFNCLTSPYVSKLHTFITASTASE